MWILTNSSLLFFSYIFNTCKIFKISNINNYVINQIFKFQILAIKLYTQNKCINQILNNI